jgi:hypothetical protein
MPKDLGYLKGRDVLLLEGVWRWLLGLWLLRLSLL